MVVITILTEDVNIFGKSPALSYTEKVSFYTETHYINFLSFLSIRSERCSVTPAAGVEVIRTNKTFW